MGLSGVDFLLSLVAGLVAILVVGAVLAVGSWVAALLAVIGFGFRAAYRRLRAGEQDVQEAQNTMTDQRAGHEESAIKDCDSADKIVSVKVGSATVVHCRFYAAANTITRTIVRRQKRLLKRFGRTRELPALEIEGTTLDELERRTIADAKAILDEECEPKKTRQVKPIQDAQAPEKVEATEKRDQPKELVMSPPKKGVVTYRGKLLASGIAERSFGNKTSNSYGITFEDESLGSENKLWGADLERALKDSGAQTGDRIELVLIGESPVMIKGKPKTKNIWSIRKI